MSESAKVVNYTEEMVATITSEYEANPVRSTVDSLAECFDKSPRSVTKTGAPVVKKETLVAEINSKLGVELPSLVKANKQDLEALFAALS